jgi:LuxR family transcriptional regulator, maltose regulon positive regulatory protein
MLVLHYTKLFYTMKSSAKEAGMLKLSWLGSPYAEVDGVQLHFETRKVSALLAYLSLTPKSNPREILATLFWPEFDQVHALANLRRALGSLNRILPAGILEADREAIRWLEAAPAQIDVLEYRSGIARVRSHSHNDSVSCSECLEILEGLADLYRGDFLEGLNLPDSAEFDDWQYFLREELRREYAWVLEQQALGWADQGEFEKAASAARRLVNLDRLDTHAQLALVEIYSRSGKRSLAQRQYEEFCRLLVEELGQGPDETSQESFLRIIKQVPPVREDAKPSPPARSLERTLLKTKLYLPKARPHRLHRPRLLLYLKDIPSYALTLVSAPAGFGKTSLLAEWAVQVEYPVAWLSLDAGDNDPSRFLTYLGAALDNLAEGVAVKALAVLDTPQPVQPISVITVLLNDIEKLAQPLVLVLDDYQFITSQPIHEALAYLLEHITPNLHVVIASRADPPFPLARLRAQGDLLELRTDDLRFTLPEMLAFFNSTMSLDLPNEDVEILSGRTEGWAVGLQMAAISIQGNPDRAQFIRTFSGSHRFILDYLIEEVLSQQSEPVRDFLLKTSILERLCSGLCEAVVGDGPEPAYRILEYLDRANLFLVPLDAERHWYRYHHLFADLLASQLQRMQPEQSECLHTRASVWLEENGLIDQAIEHALAAQDYERASDLLEKGERGGLITQVDFSRMQNWINRIPQEMILKHPWIGISQGWLWLVSGKVAQLGEWLDRVESNFQSLEGKARPESERGDIQAHIASLRAYIAFFSGNLAGTIEYANLALGLISPSNDFLRARIMVQLGETHLILQDLPVSEAYLRKAIELGMQVREHQSYTTALMRLFKGLKLQGKLIEADEITKVVLEALAEAGRGDHPVMGKPELCWGDLLRERLQLDEAQIWIDRGLVHSRIYNVPFDTVSALTFKARLLRTQRLWEEAGRVLEEAVPILESSSVPQPIASAWALERANVWLGQGNMERVESWIEESGLNTGASRPYPSDDASITLARILLRQGKPREAGALLAKLSEAARSAGRKGSLIQILLLEALSLHAQGCISEALDRYLQCLSLARPEMYLATFLDEGTPAAQLLDLVKSQELEQPMRDYVGILAEALSTRAGAAQTV